MRIRLYGHAWQALLMLLAGVVSVVAAFAGYIRAGGGEEILRRALARMETGAVKFDSMHVDWLSGEMTVLGVTKKNAFEYGEGNALTVVEGLSAESFRVKMDVYPWPPEVTRITVSGIKNATIKVSDGFLQSGNLPARSPDAPPLPPIAFEDCNLKVIVGGLQPVQLSGCSGELRVGRGNALRGEFSLRKLNDHPFNFKLETLEDGRWIFTGDGIQLDTRQTLTGSNPFAGKVDPVGMLIGALFSGQMGAKGTLRSLRVAVQPASNGKPFSCDGEVAFSNLEFKLPRPEEQAGRALPYFLSRLLGGEDAGESLWPRWMQVDAIRTGPEGRLSFHMANNRLEFAADEGPGSVLTGERLGQAFPPLEGLKGTIETDAQSSPRQILLRGFLGAELAFETRVNRAADESRTFDLVLQPRAANQQGVTFNRPLWRFASRVQDFRDADTRPQPDASGERPLVLFELEADVRRFPWPELLLPGMRDVAGRIYGKGRFTDKQMLRLDDVRLDSGATIVYGGRPDPKDMPPDSSDFGPLWRSLRALFDTSLSWSVQDAEMQGTAEVQFGMDLTWERTTISSVKLTRGQLVYAGLSSDLAPAELTLSALHERKKDRSTIDIRAAHRELWSLRYSGEWKSAGAESGQAVFRLVEKDVPFALHPQRENPLLAPAVSPDKRRVNRTSTVELKGSSARVDVTP